MTNSKECIEATACLCVASSLVLCVTPFYKVPLDIVASILAGVVSIPTVAMGAKKTCIAMGYVTPPADTANNESDSISGAQPPNYGSINNVSSGSSVLSSHS